MRHMKIDHRILLLSLVSGIFMGGIMGTRPLVPLLSNHLGATHLEIGIIVSFFSLLPLLFIVPLGRWVDRIGTKTPLILSSLLGSMGLMIPYFLESLSGIYTSQLISGLSQTIYVVAAQSFVGAMSEKGTGEINVTRFSIGVAIGSFIGPLVGGLLSDHWGYPFAFGVLGAIALSSALLAFFFFHQESSVPPSDPKLIPNTSSTKPRTLDLLKSTNIRRAIMISALVLLGKDMYLAYFPLLAASAGVSTTKIGLMVSINALAAILIRWFMPRLIESFTRNRVIIGSIFMSGLLFTLFPFFQNEWVLIGLSFTLGFGLGIGQPLSISTTLQFLPKDRVGEGLGLRLSINRLTQATGPALFGMLSQLFSLSSIFWLVGFIMMIGCMKTRIREEEAEPDLDHSV
jgi:predicted MFS family arabinose efflux permease